GSDAKASRGAGANAVPTVTEHKDRSRIITDDPFFAVLADYPDSVVDFCLVANDHTGTGYDAHRRALACAANELFTEENGEVIWRFDVGKADAKQIAPDALFARTDDGALNYRRAFLAPPYPNGYTDADFTRLNAALFPNGTDALEVFEWTTDWSEYFDEGHEWWGALCVTAYDRTLDRFAVILASATD
ncbi:MAG: hypothetical protein IKW79_02635, partial [Schwartzia sp.]|nr:hypothetical protein [Schwartzia sp. (in: firmicutes)]